MGELLTSDIEPGKELSLVDHINELDIVIKPALRILYELEEDINICNEDVKSVLFNIIWQWDRIDKVFMRHNRKLNGLPEVLSTEAFRQIRETAKPSEAKNQTIEA